MTITPRQIRVGTEYSYIDLNEQAYGFKVEVTGVGGFDDDDRVEYGIIHYGTYARLSPRSTNVRHFCENATSLYEAEHGVGNTTLIIALVIAAAAIYMLFIR